jgi:23S rRNA (guanosine2251-2'-O)-methyltransferase
MSETIYGRNPVYECLMAGRRQVFHVSVARGAQERGTLGEIVAHANRIGVPVRRVERSQLDRLEPHVNHQGVAAEVSGYPYVDVGAILAFSAARDEAPWVLLLDSLQDPQNLGTLLRTAEVVGAHGVIIPDRRAAEVTPAVVNSSSGASEHLLIAQITNMVRTMEQLKERSVWIAGLEDVPEGQMLWESDLSGAVGLVVGSEGAGMRRLVREACDWMVRLPVRGRVNSLNAAVAGSVALYEMARQRMLARAEARRSQA